MRMVSIISTDQDLGVAFSRFSQLPPELRVYIWNVAIAKESGKRIVLLDVFHPGRLCPTQDLASPFLSVNQESRKCATRYYDCKVTVTRRETAAISGTIYLRPEEHCFTIDQMGNDLKFGMECNNCVRCPRRIPVLYEAFLYADGRSRVATGLLLKQCPRGAYIQESWKFLPNLRRVYWMKWKGSPCLIHSTMILSALAHLGPAKTTRVLEYLGAYWFHHDLLVEKPPFGISTA